jgi:hypothetical protein
VIIAALGLSVTTLVRPLREQTLVIHGDAQHVIHYERIVDRCSALTSATGRLAQHVMHDRDATPIASKTPERSLRAT